MTDDGAANRRVEEAARALMQVEEEEVCDPEVGKES